AARASRHRMPMGRVTEPKADKRRNESGDRALVGEELERLLAREVAHLSYVLALERDVERVAVVASALAHLTRDVHIGQEVHLDLDRAVACTRLAAASLDVEREPARLVTTHPRFLGLAEQLADGVEDARVGGGVGPRRTPDGRLVDVDDLVEELVAFDGAVTPRDDL